jgi:hypothetical protein
VWFLLASKLIQEKPAISTERAEAVDQLSPQGNPNNRPRSILDVIGALSGPRHATPGNGTTDERRVSCRCPVLLLTLDRPTGGHNSQEDQASGRVAGC